MLYKPKFLSPGANVQQKTIDVESDSWDFSCIVDGNEAISSWKIDIINSGYKTVFTTGRQTFSDNNYFYPVDEKGRNNTFKVNLRDYLNLNVYDYLTWKQVMYNEPRNTSRTYYTKNGDGTYTIVANSTFENDLNYWVRNHTSFWYQVPISTSLTRVGYYKYNEQTKQYESSVPNEATHYSYFSNNISMYYWTITFWGATGSSCSSHEEAFRALSTPTIKIKYDDGYGMNEFIEFGKPLTFNRKKINFKAEYQQSQNDMVKCYGWRILDITNNNILIDTISSNHIYGTKDNMICVFDGFLSDSTYQIEFYLETQSSLVIKTEPIMFNIKYLTTFLTGDFETLNLDREAGVINTWEKSVAVSGKAINRDVELYKGISWLGETSKLITFGHILGGAYVQYNHDANSNLDVDENSCVMLSTKLPFPATTVLLNMEGYENGVRIYRNLIYVYEEDNTEYPCGKFLYNAGTANGRTITKTVSAEHLPHNHVWFIIKMSISQDTEPMIIKTFIAKTGLYPDSKLFPSGSTYPDEGKYEIFREDGE